MGVDYQNMINKILGVAVSAPTFKNICVAEFAVLVERIIPAGEIENNWK